MSSLSQAVKEGKLAVNADSGRSPKRAISLYRNAIRSYRNLKERDTNPRKKDLIQDRIERMVRRIREIEAHLTAVRENDEDNMDEDDRFADDELVEDLKEEDESFCSDNTAPKGSSNSSSASYSSYKPTKFVDFITPAIEMAKKATLEDEKRNYSTAYKLYVKAVNMFLVASKHEKGGSRKTVLTTKASSLLTRAEEIKKHLGSTQSSAPTGGTVPAEQVLFDHGLKEAKKATDLDRGGKYKLAVQHYMLAMEAFIKMVKLGTVSTAKKTMVKKEIAKYMARAEQLRGFIKKANDNVEVYSKQALAKVQRALQLQSDLLYGDALHEIEEAIALYKLAKRQSFDELKQKEIGAQVEYLEMRAKTLTKRVGGIVPPTSSKVPDFSDVMPPQLQFQGEVNLNVLQSTKEIPHQIIKTVRILGKGAYGTVWLAKMKNLDVAVKKIPLSVSPSVFEEEVRLVQSLNHIYVVKVFGYFLDHSLNEFNMVMEYLGGGDLHEHYTKNRLSLPQKMKIILQMCESVAYIHAKRVVHRDIKGCNFLICGKTGIVKLTDFGLATLKLNSLSLVETKSSNVGSARWIAPELIGLHPKYSYASDVYSLGMSIFELLANEVPFKSQPNDQIIISLIKSDSTNKMKAEMLNRSLQGCPQPLKIVLKKCLEFDYRKRPSADGLLKTMRQIDSEMAKKDSLSKRKVHDSMLCPITKSPFIDPVILVETGITYEKFAILQWLMYHTTCPITGKQLKSKCIKSNSQMKTAMENWQKRI